MLRPNRLERNPCLRFEKSDDAFMKRVSLVLFSSILFLSTATLSADGEFDQLLKKAEAGDSISQYNLGLMYAIGRGVEKDYVEAAKWYCMASEQGLSLAQSYLGAMYSLGRGVEKDDVEAVKWYRKAAEQGCAEGQLGLGAMYANGRGVEKDYVEAVEWYRKAAEQGYAAGQSNLGLMYAKGQGVEKDYVEGYAWSNISAAKGNDDAAKYRDALESIMSPQQIADAQKRTKELKTLIAEKQAASK